MRSAASFKIDEQYPSFRTVGFVTSGSLWHPTQEEPSFLSLNQLNGFNYSYKSLMKPIYFGILKITLRSTARNRTLSFKAQIVGSITRKNGFYKYLH